MKFDPAKPDRAALTAAVRRALGMDTAEIGDWHQTRLAYPVVNPVSRGLYRFSGNAFDAGVSLPWSLLLKVVHCAGERTRAEQSVDYWLREPLAYQSELLNELTAGLTAPRCYGVVEQPDEMALLWLEDVNDAYDGHWPLAAYGPVARRFGRFNGEYLVRRPLPSYSWLSRGVLASMVEQRGRGAIDLIEEPASWEHPLLRSAFPVPVADRLLRLWRGRGRFLAAVARLPRVLCHFDVSRHNLFARHLEDGSDDTVVIDWAYPGVGAVGEELSLLVPSPFFRFEENVAGLPEHAEDMFASYLRGLREAGWQGDSRLARFGYAASTALRTAFIAPTLRPTLDDQARTQEEQHWQLPFEQILGQRAAITYFLLDLADEAQQLMAELRLG